MCTYTVYAPPCNRASLWLFVLVAVASAEVGRDGDDDDKRSEQRNTAWSHAEHVDSATTSSPGSSSPAASPAAAAAAGDGARRAASAAHTAGPQKPLVRLQLRGSSPAPGATTSPRRRSASAADDVRRGRGRVPSTSTTSTAGDAEKESVLGRL